MSVELTNISVYKSFLLENNNNNYKWHCHISVPGAVDAGENGVLVVGGYEPGAVMLNIEEKAKGTYGVIELFKKDEYGDQTKPPILHNGYFYAQYAAKTSQCTSGLLNDY